MTKGSSKSKEGQAQVSNVFWSLEKSRMWGEICLGQEAELYRGDWVGVDGSHLRVKTLARSPRSRIFSPTAQGWMRRKLEGGSCQLWARHLDRPRSTGVSKSYLLVAASSRLPRIIIEVSDLAVTSVAPFKSGCSSLKLCGSPLSARDVRVAYLAGIGWRVITTTVCGVADGDNRLT